MKKKKKKTLFRNKIPKRQMYLLGNQIAEKNVMVYVLKKNIKGVRLSEWKTKHHEFLTLYHGYPDYCQINSM